LTTDGSGYVNLRVQLIKAFSKNINLSDVTGVLASSFGIDYTGLIYLTANIATTYSTLWLNGELMDVSGSGSTWTITARGKYGTLPRPHFAGETVYGLSAGLFPNPANGVVLTEVLTGSNLSANQLTRLPYATGDYTAYDVGSVLGSWTDTLYTPTWTWYDPPNTSFATYTNSQYVFYMNPLVSKQSYPVNDLAVGQLITARTGKDYGQFLTVFAVAAVSSPDSTTGVFSVNAYLLDTTALPLTLSSSIGIDTTTITATTAFPATCYTLWIDGEFMYVVSGAGTTSVTVVRGTPDVGAYPRLQASSRHNSGTSIYWTPWPSDVPTFDIGTPFVEGKTDTIIAGTTRLGY